MRTVHESKMEPYIIGSLTDEELNSSLTDEDTEESHNLEGSSTAPSEPSPPKKRVESPKSEKKEHKDTSQIKLMGVTDEGESKFPAF